MGNLLIWRTELRWRRLAEIRSQGFQEWEKTQKNEMIVPSDFSDPWDNRLRLSRAKQKLLQALRLRTTFSNSSDFPCGIVKGPSIRSDRRCRPEKQSDRHAA
jgi:hypothetical protein